MFQRGAGAGRGRAAGVGRGLLIGRGSTAALGIQEAPNPVVARACGTWKSRQGPGARLPGQPTMRKAQFPGGLRMTREANAGGRKAAGNRDECGRSLRRPCRITGRIPGGCPDPKGYRRDPARRCVRRAAPIATGVQAGSAPEQPRQHRSAAGGAGVGCAAASLMLRCTGQHLLDVLTASGVAGLAAGAAGGGTAHEVSPFRGSRWSESDDPE